MEAEAGAGGIDNFIQVEQTREVSTHPDAVPSLDLRENVRVAVSPLVEDARSGRPEVLNDRRSIVPIAADRVNRRGWQAKRFLWIARHLIPAPSGSIDARFIQQ